MLYQAGMDQALERALAAESSSSPQREVEHSLGGVKTQQEVPVKDVSSSSSTGVIKSQVVDMWLTADIQAHERLKKGVKSRVSEVSSSMKIPKGHPVKEEHVQDRSGVRKESLGKVQSTEKESDWKIVKGKRSELSTGTIGRSTEGGKSEWGQPSSLPRNSVPEGGNYSRKGAKVPVEKQVIMKQKVPAMQEATVEAVVKRDVGMGETVKSGLSKDLCTDMVCSDFVGGAVFGVGAAGNFIPLVGAGAMKGSSEHVLVVGTPKGGHVHVGLLCDSVNISPNAGLVLLGRKFSGVLVKAWEERIGNTNGFRATLLNADSTPQSRPRRFDAIIQQLTMVDVATRRRGRRVQVLEVRGRWRVENELAKTQIDAVNTDVINKESVCPWSVEGAVLCVSYSVLGIYFGRRR